jgi:hypothetical protein
MAFIPTLLSLTIQYNMKYLDNLLSLSNYADGFSAMSDKEQRSVVHWIQVLDSVIGKEALPLVDLLLRWHFAKLIPEEVSWALVYDPSPDTLIILLGNHSGGEHSWGCHSSELTLEQYTQIADMVIETQSRAHILRLLELDHAQQNSLHLSPEQRTKAADALVDVKKWYYAQLTPEQLGVTDEQFDRMVLTMREFLCNRLQNVPILKAYLESGRIV